MKRMAFYITAHGYGHGVRSCDIVRGYTTRFPGAPVTVVSDLPEDFLRSRIPARDVVLRRAAFDVGMVQKDSIRVDLEATVRAVTAAYARHDARVGEEARWLEAHDVGVVVADLPSIPLAAAAAAGLPAIGEGNFAWDWIYGEFLERGDTRWAPVIDTIRADYGRADLLLRIPFAEPMTSFRAIEDIPLVAQPGRRRREELARLTGADPRRTWVLLSFTTLDWDEASLARVESLDRYAFLTVKPLQWPRRNFHPVDRQAMSFADVVASCDAVVTKPGYGILSDCAVNDTPIVYADREDFREYHVLVESMRRYHRAVHIPAADLYAGQVEAAIERARTLPPPLERLAAGGEFVAAERIASFL
jgi:hypothetical protein